MVMPWLSRLVLLAMAVALTASPVIWSGGFPGPAAASERTASRQELESAYLYNFLLFVHWPGDDPIDKTPMTICVLGDDALGHHLAPVIGKSIKGSKRTLRVKNIRLPLEANEVDDCALLFVSAQATTALPEIMTRIKGKPILTVSDHPDFVSQGGMIALVEHEGRLRWQVNQGAAGKVGLRFDAQLLRSAIGVVNSEQERLR